MNLIEQTVNKHINEHKQGTRINHKRACHNVFWDTGIINWKLNTSSIHYPTGEDIYPIRNTKIQAEFGMKNISFKKIIERIFKWFEEDVLTVKNEFSSS